MVRYDKRRSESVQNDEVNFEQVFTFAGHAHLYERIGSKLWIYQHWSEEELHILELFLQVYGFDEEQALFMDDFLYHFRIFKNMHQYHDMSRYHF